MTHPSSENKPWWRYGYVWLVVSGPALVVIAALATAVIAVKYQDPVLSDDYYREGLEINKTLAEKRREMMPAMNARNHVMTPDQALPKTQDKSIPPAKTP
jgi:uncharacterized protein